MTLADCRVAPFDAGGVISTEEEIVVDTCGAMERSICVYSNINDTYVPVQEGGSGSSMQR